MQTTTNSFSLVVLVEPSFLALSVSHVPVIIVAVVVAPGVIEKVDILRGISAKCVCVGVFVSVGEKFQRHALALDVI